VAASEYATARLAVVLYCAVSAEITARRYCMSNVLLLVDLECYCEFASLCHVSASNRPVWAGLTATEAEEIVGARAVLLLLLMCLLEAFW